MGISAGPDMIQNGLVLALDAADRNSYISGSTTWTDISGNNNNGTLINGPTFSSVNGGSILFDGIDDYVTIGSVPGITSFTRSNNYSLSFWIYNNASQPGISFNTVNIMEKWIGQGGDPYPYTFRLITSPTVILQFGAYNGTTGVSVTSSISLDTWYNIAGVFDWSNSVLVFYSNGNIAGSTPLNLTGTIDNTTSVTIGRRGGGVIAPWAGRMSQVQIYNRALSAEEVLQNYNATKTRFGL